MWQAPGHATSLPRARSMAGPPNRRAPYWSTHAGASCPSFLVTTNCATNRPSPSSSCSYYYEYTAVVDVVLTSIAVPASTIACTGVLSIDIQLHVQYRSCTSTGTGIQQAARVGSYGTGIRTSGYLHGYSSSNQGSNHWPSFCKADCSLARRSLHERSSALGS